MDQIWPIILKMVRSTACIWISRIHGLKKRHEKRRLTYKRFLDTFKRILPEHGEIHFKTDNRGLFEYSLVSFSQYGMKLKGVWLDLHASDFEGNVMTEYEQKFSSKGQVIYRVEAEF